METGHTRRFHLVSIATITAAIDQHKPFRAELGTKTRQAAVAVILCATDEHSEDIELGFILRATREGDPWSGQMAFPGGHLDPTDRDLKMAAMRETIEEIAVDLGAARYLGSLDHQQAQPRGHTLDMVIEPHVFWLPAIPASTPNYEVAEVVWTSLPGLMSNEKHRTQQRPMAGTPTTFNGYELEQGHFVWGLTYRIVKTFFARIDPQWRPPAES